MHRDRFSRYWLLFSLALAPALGCQRSTGGADDKGPGGAAPTSQVDLVAPRRFSVAKVIVLPGTVEAFEQTTLHAKIAGYVQKVRVDIGERVQGPRFDDEGNMTTPGDILAEMLVPEMEEEANQKLAGIRQSEAEVEQARKSLAAAEANVKAIESGVDEALAAQARAEFLFRRWSSEAERQLGLVERGVIDSQTAEETQNQFGAAKAGLAEAKARVVSARAAVTKAIADRDKSAADIDAAVARCEVCKAEHRRLLAMLSYTKIRAPYDGVITQRFVSTGDFLQAGSAGKEGIFSIARLDPARVIVYVPGSDSALVREGTPIELDFQSAGAGRTEGKITRTSWSLDSGSRTLRVEVDVPNADGQLRAGTYVLSRVRTEMPESWTLPLSAVVKQGEDMVAFAATEGQWTRTPLRVGAKDDKWIQVFAVKDPRDPTGWLDITGKESFANPASGLANGQPIQRKTANKE